jgi:DNA-binding NarL/FixJ family response regulator
MRPFKVLLLDSQEVSLKGIRAILSHYEDIEIVGEAACAHDALEGVSALKPDIVIMEAMMPFLNETDTTLLINGIEIAFNIRQIDPRIKLIVITTDPYREFLGPLRKVGISACVFKEDSFSDLHSAITAVKRGGTYFGDRVSEVFNFK